MKNNPLKNFLFLLVAISLFLSACGAPADPAPIKQFDPATGEVIATVPPEPGAGAWIQIGPELPNEDALREFVTCEQTKVASVATNAANKVIITFEDGEQRPAIAISCDDNALEDGSVTMMSANTIFMRSAPINTKVLGWIYVIGVGLYATVIFAEAIEASGGISVTMSSGSSYTAAQLPTFGALAAGTATAYSAYAISELVSGTGTVSFTTYGELATGTETVYLTQDINTLSTDALLLAMMSGANQTIYATTTPITADWTLTAAEWYEMQTYARMATATVDAGVATLPPITWPSWDPKQWEHAANSRNKPILFIMLAYEAIVHTGDKVYFSPAMGYLMITTWDPYVGTIGSIFSTTQDIAGEVIAGTLHTIVPMSPVTIIFPIPGPIEKKLIRGCFSYPIWPPAPYMPQFEPIGTIPGAIGTCKTLKGFNQ